MISDEAVEAAAKFLLDDNPFNDDEGLWQVPSVRDHYRKVARGALEAAAPHMLRDAITAAERDEMAEVIWGVEADEVGTFKTGVTSEAADKIADALLVAGYRKFAK